MLGSWPLKLDRLGATCVYLEALIDPLETNGWNMVKQPIFSKQKEDVESSLPEKRTCINGCFGYQVHVTTSGMISSTSIRFGRFTEPAGP